MGVFEGKFHSLNESDRKLYAFCAGGVQEFYRERARIGGRCFAYCHVLGELTLRMNRVPTMTFLDKDIRARFRQQLCEMGRQALSHGSIQLDELSRIDGRDVIDRAVEDFSDKGRARDIQFYERQFPKPLDMMEMVRAQQNFPHEYQRFLQNVRQRVLAGPKN